jgi:hypothetical protein
MVILFISILTKVVAAVSASLVRALLVADGGWCKFADYSYSYLDESSGDEKISWAHADQNHVDYRGSVFRLLSNPLVRFFLGRAIAQAVSRWLPTTAARVRSRV